MQACWYLAFQEVDVHQQEFIIQLLHLRQELAQQGQGSGVVLDLQQQACQPASLMGEESVTRASWFTHQSLMAQRHTHSLTHTIQCPALATRSPSSGPGLQPLPQEGSLLSRSPLHLGSAHLQLHKWRIRGDTPVGRTPLRRKVAQGALPHPRTHQALRRVGHSGDGIDDCANDLGGLGLGDDSE